MLLVEYHKKYYILRGFSTSLMLCNTLEKLNNGKFRQRAAALPLFQAGIVTSAGYMDNMLFIKNL